MADASISFTTVVNPSSAPSGSQQSFSIKLGLVGNSASDLVNSFSFTATLSLPTANLVNIGGFTITTPDVPKVAGFGLEFNLLPFNGAPDNFSGFTGNSISFSGANGASVKFNDGTDRFQTINFTVAANTEPQDIRLIITDPVFTGPSGSLSIDNTTLNLSGGSITAVPEPSSVFLVVIGGVGGIYARWRSKKNKVSTDASC